MTVLSRNSFPSPNIIFEQYQYVVKKYLLFCVVVCVGLRVEGWGFFAHRLVNYHAVFLLPPEMLVLYKPNIEYLVEHSVDADKRRYAVQDEGPRHYFDMDRYGKDEFASKDVTWKQACEKFPEDTLKTHGIVPWWIQVSLGRLVNAFKEGDKKKILRFSADLAHYIGDAHVPLHASSNHNGQFTGQHGIHGFWESRIPELLAEKEWDYWLGKADYIRKPLHFIWKRVYESALAADSVLLFERELNTRFPAQGKYAFENRNGILVKQYSEAYTVEYNKMLNGMVERRFRESVYAVASFWYTAWVNAGQPDCRKIAQTAMNDSDSAEYEALNRQWRTGKINGKACD